MALNLDSNETEDVGHEGHLSHVRKLGAELNLIYVSY